MKKVFIYIILVTISMFHFSFVRGENKRMAVLTGVINSSTSSDSLWGDCMLYVVNPIEEEPSIYSSKVRLNHAFSIKVPIPNNKVFARFILRKNNEDTPLVVQSLLLQNGSEDTLTYNLDELELRFSSKTQNSTLEKTILFMEEFIDGQTDNPLSTINKAMFFNLRSLPTIKADFDARIKMAGQIAKVDIQDMEVMQLARPWAWMLYITNKVMNKPFQGTAAERRMFYHDLVSPVVASADFLPLIVLGRGDFFYGLGTQFPQWRQSFLSNSSDWRNMVDSDLLLANDEKSSAFTNALAAHMFIEQLNAKEFLSDAQADQILQGLAIDLQLELRELFKRRKKELSLSSKSYNLSDGASSESLDSLLEKYQDKKIVLDYWFEGCSACIDLNKKLRRLQIDLTANDFVFITVTDISMTSPEAWKYFTNHLGEHYLLGSGALSKLSGKYKVEKFPTLLLLDKERNVVNRWVGLMTEEEIQQLRNQLEHK